MMPMMLILVALGLGLVIYAIFEVFVSKQPEHPQKQKIQDYPLVAEDSGKEQKIQRLQSQIAKLESQLEQSKVASVEESSGVAEVKEKEAEFFAELKRREEWVAKAEAELAKIRTENLSLSNKFIAKEKELEGEFTKNVNLAREIRELKAALEAKEMACRLKEDQLQAQKHQIESQLKSLNEHAAKIAEFSRKEKISEWVPKQEFNQLNEEYTKLEKDLEVSQERLKSFAAEITQLRQRQEKKVTLAHEVKSEQTDEETKGIPPNEALKETLDTPREDSPEKNRPLEVIPEVIREEIKSPSENKPPEEIANQAQVAQPETNRQDNFVQEQKKEEVIPEEETKNTAAQTEKETKETEEQK